MIMNQTRINLGKNNKGDEIIVNIEARQSSLPIEELGLRGTEYGCITIEGSFPDDTNYLRFLIAYDSQIKKCVYIENFSIEEKSIGTGSLIFNKMIEIAKNEKCHYIIGSIKNDNDIGGNLRERRKNFYVNKYNAQMLDEKYFKKDIIYEE
ncbi:MAG: hypothetical protein ACI4SH_03025 [Candidatus Scatosoma sp.]